MSGVVEQKKVYEGRVLDVNLEAHDLPDGRRSDFEIIRHPGGAAILPVLPDKRVLLISQFRPAIGKMIYEIPAGRLEPGESALDCAARELREEAGYLAVRVLPLGGLWSTPGFCDEYIHLFYTTELVATEQELEPDEIIELHNFSLDEALALVASGEILDSKTQVALLRYQQILMENNR